MPSRRRADRRASRDRPPAQASAQPLPGRSEVEEEEEDDRDQHEAHVGVRQIRDVEERDAEQKDQPPARAQQQDQREAGLHREGAEPQQEAEGGLLGDLEGD